VSGVAEEPTLQSDVIVGGMTGGRFLAATACALLAGSVRGAGVTAAPSPGQWRPVEKVPGIVDVVGPRSDGRLVLSTRSGLHLFSRGGALGEFARGPGGYTASGGEPYLALVPRYRRLPGVRCSFHRDDVFVLDADSSAGVTRVTRAGKAVRLVDLPAGAFPSGIAFDLVGRFGYRLLVTAVFDKRTTLYAIDCIGGTTIVMRDAPQVEGGIVVAPSSFGRFGGDLIAADEMTGRILAFAPSGVVRLIVQSGLPAGPDIGVESLGFVPPGLGAGAAYFSDLGAPGSPTEGTDSLLVLSGEDLARARLVAGELVAATEAGGTTIAVRCARRCTVRRVAVGPAATHGEGHATFVPGGTIRSE
jgi:hypothetical protein